MRFMEILSVLSVGIGALAAPTSAGIKAREVVSHDSLNPISTRVQAGSVGRAIEKFAPLLHIAHGCQPYTAVDDAGNTR